VDAFGRDGMVQEIKIKKGEINNMRTRLGISAVSVALLGAVLSITSSAQLPNFRDSLDGGLVGGKRELVCPHSSASALTTFVQSNSLSASKAASPIYSGDSNGRWAYLRVGEKSVPTLEADGSTLDYNHPNLAGLLLYKKRNGTVEKSFWAHRFDKGALISSGDNLKGEGVDNFAAIKAEISGKSFCVIHTDVKNFSDLIWTNTIIMQDSDVPKSSDLTPFRKINEQFLESLPPREMQNLTHENVLYITTAKTNAGDEILTFFTVNGVGKFGHLVGDMHTITNSVEHDREAVDAYFRNMKKGGRVYVYGVDLKSIDLSEMAATHDLEVIRRGPTIVKDFLQTERQIQAMTGRKLVPETTSVLNGIPSTKEELQAMDKPSSSVGVWQTFRTAVEDKLADRFSNRIQTREELFNELTGGMNDVVFLVAHFDTKSLYFGEEKVAIDELEALENARSGTNRPRVAVLLICNAGTLSTGERSLFRRQVNSVGEILIKKGFFEKVIAPNHQIESAESLDVLTEYLTSGKVMQKGWMTLADAEYSAGSPQ
jgi:hypothetical protein